MKNLKLIYNKYIPFVGFYAMMFFGNLLRRDTYKNNSVPDITMNHEGIHVCQAEDFCKGFFGYIIFYILYFIEYCIKIIISVFIKADPYYSISFEQEAYNNQTNLDYQDVRKRFAWTKYIFKFVK